MNEDSDPLHASISRIAKQGEDVVEALQEMNTHLLAIRERLEAIEVSLDDVSESIDALAAEVAKDDEDDDYAH